MKKTNLLMRVVWIIAILSSLVGSLISYSVKAKNGPPGTPIHNEYLENNNVIHLPILQNGRTKDWFTVGANPQRTSWTPEQVDGHLNPLWYKQFEPYIPSNVQIITANNTLYISTASGLYALDADSGAEKWVYPTEMPLGHSPTIYQGIAYVGGHDRRLHAVDANTGQGLWKFEAGGGFSTNPLVVDGVIYIGSRDGYFYAIHADGSKVGQLMWKFKTKGPIDFSAAYKDGVVYFASNDSHAYALDAQTGSLVWKSAKLPGAGFHSWWPVVYREWVIFAGSFNYRNMLGPGNIDAFTTQELHDVYPNYKSDPNNTLVGPIGAEPGDWIPGTPTIDTSKPNITENGSTVPITEYFETKPWRRTYFVLNRATGEEYTTDFDQDGKPEYAPILWQGTHSGNRYPPLVGSDGVVYQGNNYLSSSAIAAGHVSGWQIETPLISIVSSGRIPVDEPLAYSAGGNNVYWNLCCDRASGTFNITLPNAIIPSNSELVKRNQTFSFLTEREYNHFGYNLENLIPGYNSRYYPGFNGCAHFGGLNGIYSLHGEQNPPIPYEGKLYMHRSNTVIAFASTNDQPVSLPMAITVNINDQTVPSPSDEQVRTRLAEEVEKILYAGHLRPGYHNSGIFTFALSRMCADNLGDYWHNPADTLYTLIRALPYLPTDLQTKLKSYLQAEFVAYPPYEYTHIGWKDGVPREVLDLPPEVEADKVNFPPSFGNTEYEGWFFAPHSFYAMWKYAEVFGDAKNIFDKSKNLLETVPIDDYLIANPHVHNAYIAGYLGYLELEKLAGYPESSNNRQELDRLLQLRITTFSKDGPEIDDLPPSYDYCRGLNLSRNFLFLVPELGQYLYENAQDKVQEAVDEYEQVAPYWFVSNFDAVYGEGTTAHLYDYHSMFQAKALILQESRAEIAHYLDVPAVAVGDLFYIDNLIATIEVENNIIR
ncbi:PQQ-binding-like beta-propeller repeat protein [Chloroflexota bacterium]